MERFNSCFFFFLKKKGDLRSSIKLFLSLFHSLCLVQALIPYPMIIAVVLRAILLPWLLSCIQVILLCYQTNNPKPSLTVSSSCTETTYGSLLTGNRIKSKFLNYPQSGWPHSGFGTF